ncbi:hypothetical protein H9P43_010198 [Blastocladiella emersonii ATCC 22665]|nr:hypothetical protein H9P43_010198 [Blastocladiella emersonii ATCC 22665]
MSPPCPINQLSGNSGGGGGGGAGDIPGLARLDSNHGSRPSRLNGGGGASDGPSSPDRRKLMIQDDGTGNGTSNTYNAGYGLGGLGGLDNGGGGGATSPFPASSRNSLGGAGGGFGAGDALLNPMQAASLGFDMDGHSSGSSSSSPFGLSGGSGGHGGNTHHGGGHGHGGQEQQQDQRYAGETEQRDSINSWRDSMDTSLRRIFENLRVDIDRMEVNIRQAENEVFRKEEEAFFMRQDEIEINQLLKRQADELQRAEDVYQAMLEERKTRKHTKKLQATIHKEAKARHSKMCYQDEAKHMAMQLRNTLAQHRKRFEFLIIHIEAKHERQRGQLEESQERKIREQRALLEIETRGLRDEVRAEVFKDFAYRMNHQTALDKHVAEQLHDLQQLELKHRKERFDAEAKALEEVAFLRATHHRIVNELETKQRLDYAAEKERIDEAREKIKLMQLDSKHGAELKSLRALHKVQVTLAARSQRLLASLRLKKWREILAAEDDYEIETSASMTAAVSLSTVGSQAALNTGGGGIGGGGANDSDNISRSGSTSSMGSLAHHSAVLGGDESGAASSSFALGGMGGGGMGGSSIGGGAGGDDAETATAASEQRDADSAAARQFAEDQARAQEQLNRLLEHLKVMVGRQADELKRVRRENVEEMRRLERSIKTRMDELDLQQDTEMRSMRKSHESAINDIVTMQQREYQMDANIRVTERKMLTERRTLNSILDAVYDAIVNIRPDGTITRFNLSAEKIFGYKADEVIGKNVRILTPEEVSRRHDGYLSKYLTTGVKSKAWNGISNFGRRKDSTLFPIVLSVSEVKEEDFHLFTGVVRDVTDKQRSEEAARAEQERKESEMKALISLLDVERTKSQSLIKEILPETIAAQLMRGEAVVPRTYPDATVLYTDLVGFTAISSAARPLDVVDMLNDLYSSFDEIIEQYDVYKVETIGDSYMVASGVPRPNGTKHLTEMAKLAIHLVKAIGSIKIRHRADVTLRMRIGIHTGPVVAGVVGRKMPRYCLFGDTVAIASKMESSGVPMKIQVSETTHDRLDALGGFNFEARGEMNIPGKGMMRTYFLSGCDGFNPTFVPKEEGAGSPLSALAVNPNAGPAKLGGANHDGSASSGMEPLDHRFQQPAQ